MILQIQPWIDQAELEELKRVIDSTFVTEATLTKEFEDRIKDLTGAKFAIAMTNGTVSLFSCLKALNIGPGDEVIVPDLTFIATANAVILAGATPVFVDVSNDTFCIDINKTVDLITDKTRAIIPVHLYGQSADMEKILDLAKSKGIHIIEDAAQGVGVKFNNQHVGTFGDLGVLSFYGNKTITCGEGGVIITNNEDLAKKCYRQKNHGRDVKGTFIHEHIGFNFAFTEMQAAIGISQLKKLDRIIEKKKQIHSLYEKGLSDLSDFKPVFIDPRTNPVYWLTSYLTSKVEELSSFLIKNDVQTRRFFYPLHKQPCYFNNDNVKVFPERIENSTLAYEMGISLPSSYGISEEEINTVISLIRCFFNKS